VKEGLNALTRAAPAEPHQPRDVPRTLFVAGALLCSGGSFVDRLSQHAGQLGNLCGPTSIEQLREGKKRCIR